MLQRYSFPTIMLSACLFLTFAIPLFAGGNEGARGDIAANDIMLVIDGKSCGILKALTGGSVFADVISEKPGPDNIIKKHIVGIIYEDLGLEMGFSLDPSIYQWISNSWKALPERKNGGFIINNAGFQFFEAMLTETTIPACDASLHNEPGILTVKLSPMNTRDGAPTLLTKKHSSSCKSKSMDATKLSVRT